MTTLVNNKEFIAANQVELLNQRHENTAKYAVNTDNNYYQ
jgi:hypothetical protein